MAAKSVLIDGLRWSIGDGEFVHIWNDKWLPTPETFKVMSPRRIIDGREHVSALIDREMGCWKSELIKDLFLPHEANSILAIPLTQMHVSDSIVWTATANGVFSVRSAYRVSRKALMKKEGGECSDNSKMKLISKTVWKLICPSKIKNFIWRVCKDILPTNVNLRKHKIPAPINCDLCYGVESDGHVLWSCDVAVAMWEMSNLKIPRLEYIPQGFLDLLWLVMDAKPAHDLEAFATTAWFLWNNRNSVRHGGQCKPAFKILEDSKQFLEEFRGVSELPLPRQPRPLKSWSPPQIGWYKVNIDGAVFKYIGHCGIGVVVQNDKGLIMGALCKNFPYPLGALEVEAKAAEVGVIFAWELGLREIILEGDFQVVMQAVSDASLAPISIQQLIVGVKSGLASFSSSKVVLPTGNVTMLLTY